MHKTIYSDVDVYNYSPWEVEGRYIVEFEGNLGYMRTISQRNNDDDYDDDDDE